MRVKIFLGALLLLILNSVAVFAQPGEPCAGVDVDQPCPLDTWVIILAIAAVIFATIHLYRKRSLQASKLS